MFPLLSLISTSADTSLTFAPRLFVSSISDTVAPGPPLGFIVLTPTSGPLGLSSAVVLIFTSRSADTSVNPPVPHVRSPAPPPISASALRRVHFLLMFQRPG